MFLVSEWKQSLYVLHLQEIIISVFFMSYSLLDEIFLKNEKN